jgi:hypothetical protein
MTAPAQPATGVPWKESGVTEFDNRLYDRGPLAAVLIRDNRGSATDISPWKPGTGTPPPPVPPVTNFSPFAADGTVRNDLFARRLVAGKWVAGATPNMGFFQLGAIDEKAGPDRKASVKHDDAMILQSNFPFDSDLTGEGLTIQFTPVQPLDPCLRRLRMNLPLSDPTGVSIVETPGAAAYEISKPVDAESIDRQIILLFARRKAAGKFIYTAEGYSLCKLTDIGAVKRDKVNADAASLTYTVLPDPYHMSKDAADPTSTDLVPSYYSVWTSGDGWLAINL